ncbi:Kinesin-associated protein 3 [Armadillidium nasatum]|uniref:Kinesin-associated protein 3 n=1 Tax=Armadillidium nasatum TaxID=96803 RepID=A0A5N5TA52_9CRUS|nr:Kinesin-associated protein 3 [Armadillidium nasatum]
MFILLKKLLLLTMNWKQLFSVSWETRCWEIRSNVAVVAREVIEKCKLIHPSKINEVQHLIQFLMNRKETPLRNAREKSALNQEKVAPAVSEEKVLNRATLNDLESYIDMLYEDMPDKIKGAAHVLQLARNPDYLEELCHNETVLGALARVLREDWKKSLDLSYNIVYTFFCFSVFSNFHSVVSHFKIGSLCMDIIEGELQRTEQYREQLTKRKKGDAVDAVKYQQEYEKNYKNYQAILAKQDQVLRVCTYLLLNIAEDVKVEEKMRRKNIVGLLVKMLERESNDLLLLVVSFLKKLSVYVENKDDMADLNIIEKLNRLIPNKNDDLLNVTLRLLLNLSFDANLRNKMIKVGLLSKLVAIMGEERHQQAVLAVLYHLSVDDKCKSMFTYTDCIPILMKLVLSSQGSIVPLELMALSVNLALNKRNAQLICEGNGLKLIFKRAFKNRDALLMKMDYVGDLCAIVSEGNCDEFVLECVGVLGNLSLPDLDFSQILTKFNFLNWIMDNLQTDVADDLVLEVVVLVGTIAADEAAAKLLVDAGLTRHESTRSSVVIMAEVPAYLIDLMHDNNNEIRKVCDATLDIIAEEDVDWATRIQCHKFRWHNSQWLDMVEEAANLDTMGGEEMIGGESLGHSYLHDSDVLGSQAGLYSDGLSSPESEDYPGINGFSDSSRTSSANTNRFSADLEQFANEILKKQPL